MVCFPMVTVKRFDGSFLRSSKAASSALLDGMASVQYGKSTKISDGQSRCRVGKSKSMTEKKKHVITILQTRDTYDEAGFKV